MSWPSSAGSPRRGWLHLLLVRRSISDPNEVAYFIVLARTGTTLPTLAKIAGLRWVVEDCFETAKSDCGLGQDEVRKREPWHQHDALACAAFAFLSVSTTRTARLASPDTGTAAKDGTDTQPAMF
ncbi:hypothetical protein ACTWJ9_18475 [Streptomyces sp. GDS52]|uniref:hypothetical protein n=1 Tax=unclassified Streptomyces TaxID=2593676 RepID=UPI00364FD6B2